MNSSMKAMDAFFNPQSVAVIGASETPASVGRTLTQNLLNSPFKGKVFLVNPKRPTLFNQKTYPNLLAIEETIDLAIIAIPAKAVLMALEECGKKKIPSVIVISAGFKELGKEGLELELKLIEIAKKHQIRLIGPNCLGLMNPKIDLNATFASGFAPKGSIAFLSQSGAMCTAVLDWSRKEGVGYSAFVSIGSMADVSWADLIEYLGEDPDTKSILLYMETIGDPKRFITACQKVSRKKPILVIKAGRTQEAAKAAASHTGSMAGSDTIFDVAMQRAGVIRVERIAELFYLASFLSKQPLPEGPHLTLITNAGGPSVLATDATILSGAKLSSLSENTLHALNQILPEAWSHANPVDLLGDARADRYEKTLEIVLQDPSSEGILVILSPQDMTEPEATALALKKQAHNSKKPILASWMGGDLVQKGKEILSEAGIPNFSFPDSASETFARICHYKKNASFPKLPEIDKKRVALSEAFLQPILKEKRVLLSEEESKRFIALWDIPIVVTHIASTVKEAIHYADQIGYPVVVKLYSHTITHKTDVGGVKLNIKTPKEVQDAFEDIQKRVQALHHKGDFLGVTIQKMISNKGYELILGSTCDAQFGPVLLFGSGGELVEVQKDSALELPPITPEQAHGLMQKTRIYQALKGVRGKKAVDLEKLSLILSQFSQMIAYLAQIKECDINPLLVSEDTLVALDARVVLHDPSIPHNQLPKFCV